MTDINAIQSVERTPPVSESRSTVQEQQERQPTVTDGKVLPAELEPSEQQPEELASAVSHIADFVQSVSRDLEFSVDDESGRTVMTVTDRETMEIVRQVPSEEVLVMSRIVKRMTLDSHKGVLLKSEA